MGNILKYLFDARKLIENKNFDALMKLFDNYPEIISMSINGQLGYRKLLHLAAELGNMEVCEYLVLHGAEPDEVAPKDAYVTPFMDAATNGNVEVMNFLLEKGARIDGDPRSPGNPLLSAVRFGHHDAVVFLIREGCDVNRIHDNLSQTAVDLALIWRHENIYKTLVDHGGVLAFGENIDWVNFSSGGVGVHIEKTLGDVFSPIYKREIAGRSISLRFANIENKKRYKLLYTMGLSGDVPRIELMCCTSFNWPVNKSVEVADDFISFPMRVLSFLASRHVNDKEVRRGFILHRQETYSSELIWPDDCEAVVAVDYIGNRQAIAEAGDIDPDENVQLLLLVPVKKSMLIEISSPKRLAKFLEKKENSNWNPVAFKFDLH